MSNLTPKQLRDAVSAQVFARACHKPTLAEIKAFQVSDEFLQLMINRSIMAYFRYGGQSKTNGLLYDTVEECHKRLTRYMRTGNTEHLVDVANFCMVAFMSDFHPDHHFKSIDDGKHIEKM